MSQSSDDKAYNSWSRTPGKQPVSSYIQPNKHISSSSDSSGIGHTPNCNSELEPRFNMFDSTDVLKKMSWDETSTNRNSNNMQFGFASQWSTNTSEIGATRNANWGASNMIDEIGTNEGVNQLWNNRQSVDGSGDTLISSSIWSAQKDTSSPVIPPLELENKNIISSEYDINFSMRAFKSTTEENSVSYPLCDYQTPVNNLQDKSSTENAQDNISSNPDKTWAQAAGTSISTIEDIEESKEQQVLLELVNRIEGWGSHNVDQHTPWNIDEEDITGSMEKLNQARKCAESNVWMNEPPNGVGVWETHYENMSERGSRWNLTNSKPKTGWDMVSQDLSTNWGERDDQSSWNANIIRGRQKPIPNQTQPWTGMVPISGMVKQTTAAQPPIGSGIRTPIFPGQRNPNAAAMVKPVPNEMTDPVNRSMFYPSRNPNALPNQMTNNTPKIPSMNPSLGGPEESNNMGTFYASQSNQHPDINRPNQTSHLLRSPQDHWTINESQQNYSNSIPPNKQQSPSANYIPNATNRINHSIEQQSPNNFYFDKQIMTEMDQLRSKKQELIMRMNSLRNMQGSHQIIQEVTRTLYEVNQQINAKEQTVKIRSQMGSGSQFVQPPPNGIINNNYHQNQFIPIHNNQRTNMSSQQSAISNLSTQMGDMKLQRNPHDLWSTSGNMSSYYGVEKQSGAYFNTNSSNTATQPSLTNFPQQRNGPTSVQTSNTANYRSQNQSYQSWQSQKSTINNQLQQQSFSNISSNLDTNNNYNNIICDYKINSGNSSEMIASNSAALSLPHNLSSNNVSSAFNSRDASHLSANINEFVPGQPWAGALYTQKDDPNLTLGNGGSSKNLLQISNDTLEQQLAINEKSNTGGSIKNGSSYNNNANINNRPIQTLSSYNSGSFNSLSVGGPTYNVSASILANNSSYLSNGTVNISSSKNHLDLYSNNIKNYLLIRNLPHHINIDMLRKGINSQKFPGLLNMIPNLMNRHVLLHFQTTEEAGKAFSSLYGNVGTIEMLSEYEVANLNGSG